MNLNDTVWFTLASALVAGWGRGAKRDLALAAGVAGAVWGAYRLRQEYRIVQHPSLMNEFFKTGQSALHGADAVRRIMRRPDVVIAPRKG